MSNLGTLVILVLATALSGCAATSSEDSPDGAEQADEQDLFGRSPPSGDCRFERTTSGDSTTIRVDYLGENAPQEKWFRFELPTKSLPLREGVELTTGIGQDHQSFKYENGQLEVVDRQGSNFTTDKIVVAIAPDLTLPGKVTYERKADLFLRPFSKTARWVCTGWKPS